MRFSRLRSQTTRLMLMLVLFASTFSSSRGEERLVRLIDIRNASSSDETALYVVICARPEELTLEEAKILPVYSPGHAWVLFAKDDPKERACVMDKSFGFWPDGESKLVGNVPGQLVNELISPKESADQLKMTHRIILRVTDAQYRAALAVASEWNKRPREYNLLAMNCTHFSMAILEALSLNINFRAGELPTDYLKRAATELDRKFGPAR